MGVPVAEIHVAVGCTGFGGTYGCGSGCEGAGRVEQSVVVAGWSHGSTLSGPRVYLPSSTSVNEYGLTFMCSGMPSNAMRLRTMFHKVGGTIIVVQVSIE